jgi:integrase/recombinase XerD
MDTYTEYLQGRGFAAKTVAVYTHRWQQFEQWASWRNLTAASVRYEHLLLYMQYCEGQGKSKNSINMRLSSIRHYYDWQIEADQLDYNPATGLYAKGRVSRVPRDLLEGEALEELYEKYEVKDARTHRNKIIISLLVYQGLSTEELEKLEAGDFDLTQGVLHLTKTIPRMKGRTIPLESKQLYPISQYLQVIRPALLQVLGKSEPAPLLLNQVGAANLAHTLSILMDELRLINPKVKHAQQLRQSVISHWLESKDIRIVQYLAGHRYVSSTERYQLSNLKALQEDLTKFHPLG